MSFHQPQQPDRYESAAPLVGTRWRINDTGGTFVVESVHGQYAYVRRHNGSAGRILAHAIRSSNAKTGYTQVTQ